MRNRPAASAEPIRERVLRRLREAGGRPLGGVSFTAGEQIVLSELLGERKVEVVEGAAAGLPGWFLAGKRIR